MVQLRDYQQQCLDKVITKFDDGVRRQLVVVATGGGKAYIAAHLPQLIGGRTLVLAHRKELLDQLAASFATINPDANIQIEQAERHASLDADIVVASTATLGIKNSKRRTKFDPHHFDLVIQDEAHRSVAPSLKRTLNYFKPKLRIGFTATPQRGDGQGLFSIYDEITYFKPMHELIREGWLVDFVGYRLATGHDISSVGVSAGDYKVGELSQAINTPARNRLAVDAYNELVAGSKAISFCVDVAHAYDVAQTFNAAGIPAVAVVGETSAEDRKRALDAFREGTIKVLSSCQLFIEGFDEPSISTILWMRPTKSPLFYTQGVGRGSRLHPDKDVCTLIDFVDVTKASRPMGLPSLMGLPADFDAQGRKLTEVAEKFNELLEAAPNEAARVKSLDDIEQAWQRIDLFTPPPVNEELLNYSTLLWMEPAPGKWVINVNPNEKLVITEDALGRYQPRLIHHGTTYQFKDNDGNDIDHLDDMADCFSRADRWIMKFRGDQLKLLDATAAWRSQPATEKQIKLLTRKGVPITADLSKGDASRMIDAWMAANPRSKAQRAMIDLELKKRKP